MPDYKPSSGDKPEVLHSEYTHDSDHDVSKEEVMHAAALTEEEQVIATKLRRKIDSLIMPLVVLVYLMNYIDRYVDRVV